MVGRAHRDNFAQIYHRVIDDKTIGKHGLAAYVALARFADFTTGEAQVRRTKLAAVARLSVRSLDAGIAELVAAGYLKVERVQNVDSSWSASRYELFDTAIAQTVVSKGGSASPAPGGGSAQDAPPPAPPARGVVHTVQEGSAHGAHQEQETFNERQEMPNELPLVGGDAVPITQPTVNQRAQVLARRYSELVPLSKFPAIVALAKKAISVGKYDDSDISAALVRLAQDGRPVTVDTLRYELDGPPTNRNTKPKYFPGQGMFS